MIITLRVPEEVYQFYVDRDLDNPRLAMERVLEVEALKELFEKDDSSND